MRWTVHIEGGPRRVNHAAVRVDDKIYSFGGYCSTEEYKDWEPIPVHVLNTSNYRWDAVEYKKDEDIPFQRYGHSAVSYGDKVYMWGGRNNAVACDTLSCFDTKELEWSTPVVRGVVPYARDGHSACIIDDIMYIFGGFEYVSDQYSQDVHSLNLITMEWAYVNTQGTPPCHRDFHSAIAYEGKMYIYGGRGDLNSPYSSSEEIYCTQIFCLDVIKKKWSSVSPTGSWPEGRRSHSAWLYNDFMYIFGGLNAKTRVHFNDVYRYSMKGNYWEYLNIHGVGPSKRRRQACLIYNHKVYLFGGTSPSPNDPTAIENDEENTDRLRDNSDLHVLDFTPTLKTLSILSVLKHNLDQSILPWDVIFDIKSMTLPNQISRPTNQSG